MSILTTPRILPVVLACLCFGCAFDRTSSGVTTSPESYLLSASSQVPSAVPRGQREVVEPVLPTLYGRDGSPVSVQRGGTVDGGRRPTHELESPDGSRMYILELYQQAIDEKEALEIEVQALSAALTKANDALQQGVQRTGDLQKMLEGLRSEVKRLDSEGQDLASRLQTAQIRRLEAEKLLLEAKLEWSRLQKMMLRRAETTEAGSTRGEPR